MLTFKTKMLTFKTSMPINYYEINNHREASPVTILNFLEEAAIRHSESVGCGIDKLLDKGQGWLLTRWSLHMKRYPQWREIVSVETWPFKFERFYANREFKITDSKGELLGAATSLWVFFDINRKRPVRIPPEITGAYGTNAIKMVEDDFDELPLFDDPDSVLEFRVRLADIDTNNHVNNTKYVEWLIETVPFSVHKGFFLSSVEVAYKKETIYGAHVLCEIKEFSAGVGEKNFLHRIIDGETGVELTRARTIWRERG